MEEAPEPRNMATAIKKHSLSALSWVLSFLLTFALFSFTGLFRVTTLIEPGTVFHLEKKAWGAPFHYWNPFLQAPRPTVKPPWHVRSFRPGVDRESALQIRTGGKKIRKGQSDYAAVANQGDCRYLHIDGGIIFSFPDSLAPGQGIPRLEARFPVRVKTEWAVIIALLLAIATVASSGIPGGIYKGAKKALVPLSILGLSGMALFAMNIYGTLQPLRSPGIMLGNDFVYDHDPELWPESRALALLSPKPGRKAIDFARQATMAVNKGMAYTWPESRAGEYRMRIPAWENYILWFFSLFSEGYYHYEFYDHKKALARGLGMCGQQAACLTGFLRAAGLDARMVALSGHIVATVRADGKDLLLDPSFGVVIPLSLSGAQKNLGATAGYYGKHWPLIPSDQGASPLVPRCPSCVVLAAYAGPAGRIDPHGLDSYFGGDGVREKVEKAAYALKWPFPAVLILIGGLWTALLRRRAGQETGKRETGTGQQR